MWEEESDFGDMQQQLYSVREVYDDVKATRNALWDLAARKGDPVMQRIIKDHHGAWFTRTLTFLKMKRDIQYHGWEGQDLYDRYPEYSREMLNCIKDCPNPRQLGYIGMPTPEERERNRDAFDEILERRKKDPYTYMEAGPTLRRLAREINESFLAEFDFAGAYRWSRHVWELVTGRADLSAPVEAMRAPVEAMRALRIDDKLATRGYSEMTNEKMEEMAKKKEDREQRVRFETRRKAAAAAFTPELRSKAEAVKRRLRLRKILSANRERDLRQAINIWRTRVEEKRKREAAEQEAEAKREADAETKRQKEIPPLKEKYEADRNILSRIESDLKTLKENSSDLSEVAQEILNLADLQRYTATRLNEMNVILNDMKSADTATFNELSQRFGELHNEIQQNCKAAGGDTGSCAIMEISPSDLSDPE